MNPIERLISLFAPHKCLDCGEEGAVLCAECTEKIQTVPDICYGCGKLSVNFKSCPKCVGKFHPQHVWIYAEYADFAAELVRLCKFEHLRQAANAMAAMISDSLPHFADEVLVAYVPTAPSRRRERGFDHAELLAKELAMLKGWRWATLLARQKNVRQLGAKRDVRKEQLKGVFRPMSADLIKGRHIILIDDVVTTGATLEACTRELVLAGASAVDAIVFARTPMK